MPTLDEARAIIERGRAKAKEIGVPMAIAVVDAGGHLVALERMDGAPFTAPEIAWGKAYTAAAWKAPSGALAERIGKDPAFSAAVSAATGGRFTPRQGALPLAGGGAVGASGGASQQDEDVARAGIG
ncbi:MAG: heme-binding protein [Chloroflexota bacterium]|nr:heme-binding protein [Chloroflexota bacterium]